MTFTMFWFFHKHTMSLHSVFVDGFGVCLEMGKKCFIGWVLYIFILSEVNMLMKCQLSLTRYANVTHLTETMMPDVLKGILPKIDQIVSRPEQDLKIADPHLVRYDWIVQIMAQGRRKENVVLWHSLREVQWCYKDYCIGETRLDRWQRKERRLMFWRSWVRIPAPYWMDIFHFHSL